MTKIYQKRFCVECDGERNVYIVKHTNYAMYHCCQCKQEVARVGDAPGVKRQNKTLGAPQRTEDEFGDGLTFTQRAESNPDVLSDEQTFWPQRDEEAQAEREDALRTFKVALAGLTTRQRQVLEAVRVHKTQTRAAFALGISQPVVKKTLNSIKMKLAKKGIESSVRGRE